MARKRKVIKIHWKAIICVEPPVYDEEEDTLTITYVRTWMVDFL